MFIMLPFLNNNVINNTIRIPVVILLGLALYPHHVNILLELPLFEKLALVCKELFIGLLLACLICTPFWVIHAVGCIIDNQRGATISSSIDPVSGVDTSELANYFNLFCTIIFLNTGGLVLMLGTIHKSYDLMGPAEFTLPPLHVISPMLNFIITRAITIASPLIAIFLLTEAILGLLSRYAPQMNVFSLSLTVKSFIGFFILLLYIPNTLPDMVRSLTFAAGKLSL